MVSIPLTLDLWALGHSANDIKERLGHRSAAAVTRIVAQARSIGDPRAVYHESGGRVLGKGETMQRARRDGKAWVKRKYKTTRHNLPFEVVELILSPRCSRGHERTADNLTIGGACRTCDLARKRVKR